MSVSRSLWLAAEFRGERCDLVTRVLKRAGAVNCFGCVPKLFPNRQLSGDAPASFRFAQATREEAFELLLGFTPGHNEAVEFLFHAGFDEERSFNESGVARAISLPFVELPENYFLDPGVDDGVQPIELGAVGENNRRKFAAVNVAAGIHDRGPEFPQNFVVRWLAGFDEFVSQ